MPPLKTCSSSAVNAALGRTGLLDKSAKNVRPGGLKSTQISNIRHESPQEESKCVCKKLLNEDTPNGSW